MQNIPFRLSWKGGEQAHTTSTQESATEKSTALKARACLIFFKLKMLWRVACRVWLNICCTSKRLRLVVLFKQWLELSIERRYDVMACWSIHGNTLVSCTGRPKFLTRCCINCLFSFLFHFMTIISLLRYYQLLTQLVVYYQCCVLIGWATTRLYVIAH